MGSSCLLKWRDLVLVLVLVIVMPGEPLTGGNVCYRMENYTATWKEPYEELVSVQSSSWCLSVPPRCWRTHQEIRQRFRTKGEVRQRNVTECCVGYTLQKLSIDDENNTATKCVAISQCKPGFIGKNCNIECPSGSWGILCNEACNCSNHVCNPITGACQCPPGWIGRNCSEKCGLGKWGLQCASDCSCLAENESCHHVTGNCSEVVKPIKELSGSNDRTVNEIFETSTPSLPALSTARIQPDSIDITAVEKKPDNDDIKDFSVSPRFQKIDFDEMNLTTGHNEIAPNPTIVTTIVNKYHEYSSSPDVRVVKVSKSTARPILALVHVSGKTVTGHDKMIVTPVSAENMPVHTVPLSLDIAVIVVIGSVLSLGLTTLAVLSLLHVRSKLFETIRLSIYDAEKLDNHRAATLPRQKETDDERIQSLTRNSRILAQSSDYETPRCIIPDRPPTLARSTSTLTRESTYSNQFPNIRLFSSPQELLEAHYDRPPTIHTFRQQPIFGNNEGEHLYDEIPLVSTMLRKCNDVM